ncbi:MAG TPA: anthranilate synthase component I [Caulobacteraceae bacterium]
MSAETSFRTFAQGYESGAAQLVWTRLIDDLETPISAYLKIAHGRNYAFLFESVEGGAWRGRYSILAMNPDLVWRCRGDQAEIAVGDDIDRGRFVLQEDRALDSLRDAAAAARIDLPDGLPPMATGLFGVFGYDVVRLIERLPYVNPDPLDLPDAILIRPTIVAIFDGVAHEILIVSSIRPDERPAEVAFQEAQDRIGAVVADLSRSLPARSKRAETETPPDLTSAVDRTAYGKIVERAKAYIRAGDVFQVVPSHRFSAPFAMDPFALYRSLRRVNPSPFLYFLNFNGFQLVGSSPEILVRLRDGKITIRPLAGTRRRGVNPAEDLALERELLADPKERAEHLMLLDLGRNDVGRVALLRESGRNEDRPAARKPRVRVTESFAIERLSHVMHIVSNVEGDAPEGLDPVDVLLAALPAGTLSGAPKIRAMEIIDELEDVKRGVAYAGAVGYFGADGSVDTCIVLRTGLVKDGVLYVQAGGGVVADSDPNAEYEETLQKAGALRRAAAEAWQFA